MVQTKIGLPNQLKQLQTAWWIENWFDFVFGISQLVMKPMKNSGMKCR